MPRSGAPGQVVLRDGRYGKHRVRFLDRVDVNDVHANCSCGWTANLKQGNVARALERHLGHPLEPEPLLHGGYTPLTTLRTGEDIEQAIDNVLATCVTESGHPFSRRCAIEHLYLYERPALEHEHAILGGDGLLRVRGDNDPGCPICQVIQALRTAT